MIKAIIFDLDGTLTNTIGSIGHSCNLVLEKYGYEQRKIKEYEAFVGNGLNITLERACNNQADEEKAQLMYNDLVETYEAHPIEGTVLYDGMAEVLDYLYREGIVWGIHTNKAGVISQKIAKHFFGKEQWKPVGVYGPGPDIRLKPYLDGSLMLIQDFYSILRIPLNPDEILFVGDTEVDIDTGVRLGVHVLNVTYGFRDKEYLQSLNPEYIIDKPIDIISAIEAIKA